MKKSIQLVPSGISIADNAWGGFYRGGTYLLVGPKKSGRTLLGLQFAMECAKQKEVCLFFTNMRPKDLMIQAASIDFDLQHYMNQNLIIVVKVAPPSELTEFQNPDELLIEYLRDIATVVEQYNPDKIVFDELTPFIGFDNTNLLEGIFLETTEKIENASITSLFIVAEPAGPGAKQILSAINSAITGVINLEKQLDSFDRTKGGTISITPNIGHTEGRFTANYYVEAYKGITTDFQPVRRKTLTGERRFDIEEDKYTSLAEIEVPPANYSIANLYSIDDFTLILNNQIAFFKSTGRSFTLVSIKYDSSLEKMGLLTIDQLQNAVRLGIERKDKICTMGSNILILITNDDQRNLSNFIARVKNNLPKNEPDKFHDLLRRVSLYAIKVNDDTNSADDLLKELMPKRDHGTNSFN